MNHDELIFYKQGSLRIFWIKTSLLILSEIAFIIYITFFMEEFFSEQKIIGNFSLYHGVISYFIISLLALIFILLPKILTHRAYLKRNPILLSINKNGFHHANFDFLNWSDVESFKIKTKSTGDSAYKYLAINISQNINLGEEKKFLGLINKKKTSIDIIDGSTNIKLSELISKLETYKQNSLT